MKRTFTASAAALKTSFTDMQVRKQEEAMGNQTKTLNIEKLPPRIQWDEERSVTSTILISVCEEVL